ncbi:hypothetical protein ACUX4R_28125, partial [Salmonella enterica]
TFFLTTTKPPILSFAFTEHKSFQLSTKTKLHSSEFLTFIAQFVNDEEQGAEPEHVHEDHGFTIQSTWKSKGCLCSQHHDLWSECELWQPHGPCREVLFSVKEPE